MKFRALLLAFTVALVLPPALRADHPDPGHSALGEAFDEGPRQAAVLMGGTGKVDFPITTTNALAKKFFNQGVGQLHGFWFFEAERSFRQVAALDTNCAIAYWGMAMANFGNQKRAKEFIKVGTQKKSSASKREQLYLEGLAKFYEDDKRERKAHEREFVRSLENIVQEHPKDIEAKAFLARFIWEYRGNNPISSHQAVDTIIDEVFRAEPMHPAHHFRIHLWNSEKDKRALESAARCGQSAPGIAHMWHMPGHTYSALKRYDDAAWQQEASARTDHAQMMKYWVLPDQIHNYAHNNEWLIRDFNHIGRVHDAVELAKNMIELPRHPKWNTPSKGSANYGRTRLLDTLTRYELWDELLALNATTYLEPVTNNAAAEIARLRAVGLAQFNKGDVDALKQSLAALEDVAKKERGPSRGPRGSGSAGTNSISGTSTNLAKSFPKSGPKKGRDTAAAPAGDYTSTNAAPARAGGSAVAELKALLAIAKQDPIGAWPFLDEAKDIPKERLARHYLRLGGKDKAEQTALAALKGATNEIVPLATAVEILFRVGKTNEAKARFEELRKISGPADTDAPLFARLTEIAPSLGLPREWKQPAPKRTDVGKRPALDSLGPIHWTPQAAPNWTLPGEHGQSLSLAGYHGKPVVVFFYLGAECLHCVEQLNAFAPIADDFAAAGISLVAIDGGPTSDLAKTHEKCKSGSAFPFPLACDEKLAVFKQWRCYDDFERAPLHGTFLVDGTGRIRWLDISYQPFMDVKFLLAESKRLLKLPDTRVTQVGHAKVRGE
ncbi:MAG: redoxin domain-containing protein [Verrucomicrobia bacterium]|nr:redoxin domain-containing protein [Verrucomicrobiota bacterium]